MRALRFAGVFLVLAACQLLSSGHASAALCPAINGQAAGCGEVITFGPGGVISTSTTIGPYDGADDTSVGVINNSGAPIASFGLSSSLDIFGFDGDGIDGYASDGINGNALDASSAAEAGQCGSGPSYVGCYGGPNSYASNVSSGLTSGTVNFITSIPNGGSDYFSLEEAVQLTASGVTPPTTGTTVPEPATLALLGSALVGFSMIRRQRRG